MPYKDLDKQKKSKHESYLRHKERYAIEQRQTRRVWRKRIQLIKSKPCLDCGIPYPYYVMDFDHREGEEKTSEVNTLSKFGSWEAILREIAKCDVVCSNCHRIRTWKRANLAQLAEANALEAL